MPNDPFRTGRREAQRLATAYTSLVTMGLVLDGLVNLDHEPLEVRARVVLLGGTKGIGRAMARILSQRGDRVLLLGRDVDDLERSAGVLLGVLTSSQ